MATLDDKLLGEKLHYYCSSSEDEADDAAHPIPSSVVPPNLPNPKLKQLSATNTGPKGVLQDWQEYKRMKAIQRAGQEMQKLQKMEKLSLACQTYLEEQKDRKLAESDDEISQMLEQDPLMQKYLKDRMLQMMDKAKPSTVSDGFGQLIELKNGDQYLDAIDNEDKNVVVICHLFGPEVEGCESMNGCLRCLAEQYKFVKFCCLDTSRAGFTDEFTKRGVPALVVYKGGNLIGNFVRLTDEFGEDFFATDVESFLVDHGILPDRNLVPELIKKSSIRTNQERDSDEN